VAVEQLLPFFVVCVWSLHKSCGQGLSSIHFWWGKSLNLKHVKVCGTVGEPWDASAPFLNCARALVQRGEEELIGMGVRTHRKGVLLDWHGDNNDQPIGHWWASTRCSLA